MNCLKKEHTIDILKLFMRELAKTNSLGQLIEFVTGSESIPVSGRFEPELEIQFEHQTSEFFLKPRSSNNHILHLPAELGIHDLLVKLEKAFEFKDCFLSILNIKKKIFITLCMQA